MQTQTTTILEVFETKRVKFDARCKGGIRPNAPTVFHVRYRFPNLKNRTMGIAGPYYTRDEAQAAMDRELSS